MRESHDRSWVVAGLLAVVLVAGSLSGRALAADNVAEWVPEDTMVYVGVSDCDELVAAFKKTRSWQAMDDPALEDVIQPYKKLTENLRKLLAKELGLDSPKELEVYPHGGLAAFLRLDPPPAEDEDPEVHAGLVMDMGEDVDRAKGLADKIVQVSLEEGGRKDVEEVAGTQVTTIEFKKDESEEGGEDEYEARVARVETILEDVELDEVMKAIIEQILTEIEPPEEFAFAFSRSLLVVGTDAETVKATVKRLRRGADTSFAGSAAMRSLRRRLDQPSHMQFVFNLPLLIDMIMEEVDPDDKREMRAVGLPALGVLMGTAAIVPSRGVELRMDGFWEIGPERAGLGNILLMENRKTDPPSGVSADTVMYVSVNLSPSKILSEVLSITSRIDREGGDAMRAGLKMPQEDGSVLDIQKDIVDKLAGPLQLTLSLAKPYDAENTNVLVALGHKSAEAMAKLLAMVPPNVITVKEMLGNTVFELAMIPGAMGGFTDRVIIPFGTKNAVEAYIRSEGKTGRGLADDPDFKRVARHLPKQSCVMFYMNGGRISDAQVALHESGDIDPEEPPMLGATLGDYIRWGLGQASAGGQFKDPETLRKYQTNGMVTVSTEPDGLRFVGVNVPAEPAD